MSKSIDGFDSVYRILMEQRNLMKRNYPIVRLGVEHPSQCHFVEGRTPFLHFIRVAGCRRWIICRRFLGEKRRRAASGGVATAPSRSLTRSSLFHMQDINHFPHFFFLLLLFRFRFGFVHHNFRFRLGGCVALFAVEISNYGFLFCFRKVSCFHEAVKQPGWTRLL